MMKNRILWLKEGQRGQVLPLVLAALVLGAFLLMPSLSYVSTGLKAGEVLEENIKALYAAESGVEDAIWRLQNSEFDFSRSDYFVYTLKDEAGNNLIINGMTVDVRVDVVRVLAGEEVSWDFGTHNNWLQITHTESWNGDICDYVLSMSNGGNGNTNISIFSALIEVPVGLAYVSGSEGGTLMPPEAPTQINGSPTEDGITLIWVMDQPRPIVDQGDTKTLTFQLQRLEGFTGDSCGWSAVEAKRQDVGIVSEYYPYRITAIATNAWGVVQETVTAGLWQGYGGTSIRLWEISP